MVANTSLLRLSSWFKVTSIGGVSASHAHPPPPVTSIDGPCTEGWRVVLALRSSPIGNHRTQGEGCARAVRPVSSPHAARVGHGASAANVLHSRRTMPNTGCNVGLRPRQRAHTLPPASVSSSPVWLSSKSPPTHPTLRAAI